MRISDWSSDVCSSDLGVVGKTLRRQLRLRDFPQRLFHYRQARPAFDAAMAAQHALDVAVEDREAVAPGLGQDRAGGAAADRSEEHTSELQSLMRISYAVFCLKKKKKNNNTSMTS